MARTIMWLLWIQLLVMASAVHVKLQDDSTADVSYYPSLLWSLDKLKYGSTQGQGSAELSEAAAVIAEQESEVEAAPSYFTAAELESDPLPNLGVGQEADATLLSQGDISDGNQFMFSKWKLPEIKTVVVSGEDTPEIAKFELPKFELPKIEKGPVKEIPIYVYRLPPSPKIELPKLEPVNELPLVLYEMPPMPEMKLSEMKIPEIRIEKYILPPMPKFELPETEPVKNIPIVLYEFQTPDIKPLDLPKIEPIKEIPLVMYELPSLPKLKPAQLPKIKMPEVKIVKKKLPPRPELKPIDMPKIDLKVPEIKVVKYQMPEAKPFKLPELKIPEVKFVKYEMPPLEKPKLPETKLPEFKLPEFKPLELPKLPEYKLPEIKPLEFPKLQDVRLSEVYPMVVPHMNYIYAPAVGIPMPYAYPMIAVGQQVRPYKPGYAGGWKSHLGGLHVSAGGVKQAVGLGGSFGQAADTVAESQGEAPVRIANEAMFTVPAHGAHLHYGPASVLASTNDLEFPTENFGSQLFVLNDHEDLEHSGLDVSQFFVVDGHNGLALDSVAPWGHGHHAYNAEGAMSYDWLHSAYGGKPMNKAESTSSENAYANSTLMGEL